MYLTPTLPTIHPVDFDQHNLTVVNLDKIIDLCMLVDVNGKLFVCEEPNKWEINI